MARLARKPAWPSIVFSSPLPQERKRIERSARRGELLSLGRGIYLRPSEDPAAAIAAHWPQVLEHLTHGEGHISHRTALHFNPYAADWFASWPSRRYRTVSLGPKRLCLLPGMPRPELREVEFLGSRGRVSTLETALLEVTEDRRGAYARATLAVEELEEFVLGHASRIDVAALRGIAERNGRDAAPVIAVIDAVRSRDTARLRSARVRAVLDEAGADESRVRLFSDLAAFLRDLPSGGLEGRAWSSDDAAQFDRFCFIAAYFSNYIEGTEFAPEDAAAIVYRNEDRGPAPDQRTLAATYRTYLQLPAGMAPPPADAPHADFEAYLRRLHRSLAGGNEALRPGEFKTRPNQAGGLRFVEPGRVAPTLRAGWELGRVIPSPFHRAVYLGFVVSEVHPFTDGNGRAARLVTDAYLLPAGFSGLVVTTRSRDPYVRALRRASLRDSSQGDWRADLASTMERLYRQYRDLPVRSAPDALDFCRRENLEAGS